MSVVTITNDNFEQEVLACTIPVVLAFGADWSKTCKEQLKVLEELSGQLAGKVKFGTVNVDEQAALALRYQILNVPTLVVMHYGLFQTRVSGVQDRETVLQLLEKLQ